MVQAELKGHSSSISYIVRRLEQRQAAEGGAGNGVDSLPKRLSAGMKMNSKLDIVYVTSFYPLTFPPLWTRVTHLPAALLDLRCWCWSAQVQIRT
jgi:hypothetical protein